MPAVVVSNNILELLGLYICNLVVFISVNGAVVPIPTLLDTFTVKIGAVVPVEPPIKCNLASEDKIISPTTDPVVKLLVAKALDNLEFVLLIHVRPLYVANSP